MLSFAVMIRNLSIPLWALACPVLAWVMYVWPANTLNGIVVALMVLFLMGAVMAAVHHAEIVAHRIGEPFGTLLLAVAVTVIEVSLIVSLMITGGANTAELARDTVFAAVMIILTGIIGLCLLMGGLRHREQQFGKYGVNAALVTLSAITVLTLILPNYTTSVPGPQYSKSQLIFVAVISLVLYISFTLMQAQRHRDYFLPVNSDAKDAHAALPSRLTTSVAIAFLLLSLGAVVLLAKTLSPSIERTVAQAGAPKSLVGIVVAFVILLPEGMAAIKAARKNRLQISLNLALGSALASIGLTIPAVAVVSVMMGFPVTLGLDTKSSMLLFLALFSISVSFGTGRTTIQQGIVLLVLFAVYLFTTIVP